MNKGLLCSLMLVMTAFAASSVNATPILGGATGLTNPTNVITFDELGNLQGQVITNQFSTLGATFNGFGWDNATNGQAGSTGFAGGDLINGLGGAPSGSMTISFNSLVTGAAFAAVDQGSIFTISSFLGGGLVETVNINIGFNPGVGFIGFENSGFDTITISTVTNSAIAIDTLQFSVPEPGVLALFGLGFGGLVLIRRKRV